MAGAGSRHDRPGATRGAGWWGHAIQSEDWQALTETGTRAIHVTHPDWVDVHCVRQIVLRSDYIPSRPAPPTAEQPYPKDGLVIAPTRAVEPIEILPVDSVETKTLVSTLTEAFNHAGRHRKAGPVIPSVDVCASASSRRSRPCCASTRTYYVEAVRYEYRTSGPQGSECEAIAYGQGWFTRDAAGVRSITLGMHLLGCDRDGANYMLPLGALHVSDKLYWIAQFSGWDEEHFVVLEVKPKKIDTALRVWGGGC